MHKVHEQPNKKAEEEPLFTPKRRESEDNNAGGHCEKCITIGLCIDKIQDALVSQGGKWYSVKPDAESLGNHVERVRFTQVYATSCRVSGKRKDHRLGKIHVKPRHQPKSLRYKNSRTWSHEETERQERCARSRAWNLAKNRHKLKENDKTTFDSPAEEWVLLAASTKETEKREFVVASGACVHMVNKRDGGNSAELEAMRTSRSPTTVMTANGDVQTREEATVYVKELDLFVTVMLLDETPAVLSLGKLCEDHGYTYHWISAVRNHISSDMARELIAIYQTVYHLWFLVHQRVLPLPHLHLLLHHLHHRIPYLMSTDTPKIQYKKEVEVRVKSFGEIRCMNPQKPKTIKMRESEGSTKRYQRMSCLIGNRNSQNLVDERTSTEPWGNPEQGSQDTSSSSHELPMKSRAKVELRSCTHSVFTHFPKDPHCNIYLKTNYKSSFAENALVQSCQEREILLM